MKNTLFTLILLATLGLQAQHNISGTFSPAKDYKWLIAYKLKPGTQNYIADTSIKDGEFALKIPENSVPGIYRIVYAVPQEEFYFDVIYNGKESIELAFNAAEGVSFITSEENKLFNSYFKKINDLEKQLISFYTNQNTAVKEYTGIARQMDNIQKTYEEKTAGMMVHHFIKANHPHIPSDYESIFQYVKNKKDNYFKALELNNAVLQASGFLTDKLANYVFTAVPLETITNEEIENAQIENVNTVSANIQKVDSNYKLHLFYTFWAQAAASDYNRTSDHIYDRYLKAIATESGNQGILEQIEVHNRLRLGAIAPNIKWKKSSDEYELSMLEGAENYILVFWSSTCSHCLRELPALQNELKNNENVRVVAVGIEDNDITWNQESARLPHFEHAIAIGKWESEYADLYAIDKTPTYFILDKDKKIIAKPENDKEIVEFLENN